MKKTLSIVFLLFVNFITAQAQYCVPNPGFGGCDFGDLIDNFILFGENGTGIVNLNSGCSMNAYNDTGTQTVSLSQGITYYATASSLSPSDENMAIWIDFNDDFTFDNSERVAAEFNIQPGNGSVVTISIPLAAQLGSHRMRVALQLGIFPNDIDPCNTGINASDFGETHDYTITIVPPPTCPAPSSLAVGTTTQTTAALSWTGTAAAYSVEYGPIGFLPGTGTYTTTLTNSITLNPLTAGTSYDVHVRALCSTTDSSSFIVGTFSTACALSNIPYTEDFDLAVVPAIPVCMTLEDANFDGGTWETQNGLVNSLPNAALYLGTGAVANDWLFTPGINVTAGTTYEVSFSYATEGSFPESLEVKAGNAASSTAMGTTAYYSNTTLQNTTYNTTSFNYTASTTGVIYFGWHIFSGASSVGLVMDDINITVATTTVCDTSLTLTATGVTANNANIAWSTVTGASGYQYVLDQVSTNPTSGTPTIATTYNATSLTPNTTYYFHLRTACGTTFSSWKTVSFTTAPVSVVDVNANNTGVQVYPNPVTDVAFIELSEAVEDAQVQLTDISGKVLQTIAVNGKKAQVDMSKLATGVYIIRYNDNAQHQLIKVVKQ